MSDLKIDTIVEVDMPYCSLTWGTAPCAAALGLGSKFKCYQTYITCGSKANFTPGVKTFKFSDKRDNITLTETIFPCIEEDGISEESSMVNLAGSDPSMSALGRQATIDIDLEDFTYHDRFYDKYQTERISGAAQNDEPGYNPALRGTFFTNLKARWPYFYGAAIRKISRLWDGTTLVSSKTTKFIMTEFEITAEGKVRIEGSDLLDFARSNRAVAPKPSSGRLGEALTSVGTSATLIPATVGVEYPASGWAQIGSEIVTFTRVGDALTFTGRGLLGSVAAAHGISDTVQVGLRYILQRMDTVLNDLFVNYTPIPAANIPLASKWTPETNRWGADIILDAFIGSPTQVQKLVEEILVLGASIWLDLDTQEIGFKFNRPIDGDVTYRITDDDIIKIEKEGRERDRITEVLYRTVLGDASKAPSDDNLLRGEYIVSGTAKDPNAYGDTRLKEENIRWVNQGSDSVVRIAALRHLRRFDSAPIRIRVWLDWNFDAIKLTDVVYVTSSMLTDPRGRSVAQAFQVIQRSVVKHGHKLMFVLQEYDYAGRYGFCMLNTASATYSTATALEKEKGNFAVNQATMLFPDGAGPYNAI